jgi:hypothetical protein
MAHPDEDLANLGSFLEHSAASHPGHPAIRLDDFVLSYAELREAAGRMSTLLAAAGVAPGLDLLPRGQRREEDARTCRPAMHRPGGRRNSEHAAEYPDASAPLLLPLLHDFPDPGRSHRFPCSSPPSDTSRRTPDLPMLPWTGIGQSHVEPVFAGQNHRGSSRLQVAER